MIEYKQGFSLLCQDTHKFHVFGTRSSFSPGLMQILFSCRMEASCLELALEGERLCKVGDYRAGVSFFESAIQVGTEDLQILSAIYSQLGNAYFHLQAYEKALEYHQHDLTLTRTIGDELGEAKASGNLGNTLKLLGRFDEAVVCCQRHLEITRAMYDKVGQARALYNYGNVYHAKGKSICWVGAEPGEFSEEARIALKKATQYYEANLGLVKELGDRAAQGRTYGNLGNTYYLLGDFQSAVAAHEKRLLIAKEFGDKSAERRAHCNLGNAHIFLGQFDLAAGHYKRTLQLARLLKDRAVEAQACYSLGNTYTLLQDYERAIDYHLKHLVIAQDLKDRVGEGRACWSLGNAHTALGNHEQAMHFAEKHLEIAIEVIVYCLPPLLGEYNQHQPSGHTSGSRDTLGEDGFFDLLSRFQGNRMDDQRCSLLDSPSNLPDQSSPSSTPPVAERKSILECETPLQDPGHFLELLASSQARRLNDQRASLSHFPGLRLSISDPTPSLYSHLEANAEHPEGDDVFFDMLVKCQGSRLNDQRCAAPSPPTKGPTVPDEDFFSLILRSQANRMEEQRVQLPPGCTQSKPD
uniref:G protein signaling modulator 2, like n=1 Tax=Myripristis murdjan TaxID=586833 RepID=A0A668AWP4_9TELE